jgi:RNA recognition motif-containing protein
MTKTVYVGNLPWTANEEDLRDLFSAKANVTVESARVVSDRDTGRSKGFGFVELDEESLAIAVETLNNFEYEGRPLTVNEARPREERPRRY